MSEIGTPQPGLNWEEADVFTCPYCGKVFRIPWSKLPSLPTLIKCPTCNNEVIGYRSFYHFDDNTIFGAPRPGINWFGEDIFICHNCNAKFYINWRKLPGYGNCPICKTHYYFQISLNGAKATGKYEEGMF